MPNWEFSRSFFSDKDEVRSFSSFDGSSEEHDEEFNKPMIPQIQSLEDKEVSFCMD